MKIRNRGEEESVLAAECPSEFFELKKGYLALVAEAGFCQPEDALGSGDGKADRGRLSMD